MENADHHKKWGCGRGNIEDFEVKTIIWGTIQTVREDHIGGGVKCYYGSTFYLGLLWRRDLDARAHWIITLVIMGRITLVI